MSATDSTRSLAGPSSKCTSMTKCANCLEAKRWLWSQLSAIMRVPRDIEQFVFENNIDLTKYRHNKDNLNVNQS